jgi:hypothetical protein
MCTYEEGYFSSFEQANIFFVTKMKKNDTKSKRKSMKLQLDIWDQTKITVYELN